MTHLKNYFQLIGPIHLLMWRRSEPRYLFAGIISLALFLGLYFDVHPITVSTVASTFFEICYWLINGCFFMWSYQEGTYWQNSQKFNRWNWIPQNQISPKIIFLSTYSALLIQGFVFFTGAAVVYSVLTPLVSGGHPAFDAKMIASGISPGCWDLLFYIGLGFISGLIRFGEFFAIVFIVLKNSTAFLLPLIDRKYEKIGEMVHRILSAEVSVNSDWASASLTWSSIYLTLFFLCGCLILVRKQSVLDV